MITFEIWAHVVYNSTFLLNPFNVKSIAVFTVTPLLLGLGQTFVIISGGIDLSVGFTMGLSAVVTAHVFNWGTQFGSPVLSLGLAVFAGLAISVVPGVINGLLIADLKVPPFIGTLGMYGVARGVAFLLARGTTVPVQNGLLGAIGNGDNRRVSQRCPSHDRHPPGDALSACLKHVTGSISMRLAAM